MFGSRKQNGVKAIFLIWHKSHNSAVKLISACFHNIKERIKQQLLLAKESVWVSVAWFTDQDLWDNLIEQVGKGIDVKVMLLYDEINLNNGFNYEEFQTKGGNVFWASIDFHHDKWCLIDSNVVITGSYNWTYLAAIRASGENVVIINDQEIAQQYKEQFEKQVAQTVVRTPVENIRCDMQDKPVFAATLTEFVTEAQQQGYQLMKPINSTTIVFPNRSGHPQLLFMNANGARVYLKISDSLDTSLRQGSSIDLGTCPVYLAGGNTLVVDFPQVAVQ